MHFFVHNSFHSGDIIFTRPFIMALKENYPDLTITLECRDYNVYLWEDLGLPIVQYCGPDHFTTTPTPNCPADAVFLNMWTGVYGDIHAYYSHSYNNNILTFNRHMERYNLQYYFQLPLAEVTPGIGFSRQPLVFPVNQNGILVENGQVRSGQSYFPMNEYLEYIVNAFPQFTFYCSTKPLCTTPNLVDCSQFNLTLIQLSEVSNHCQALLTVGSGVDAATYTEENRFKPRCLAGMIYRQVIWDNSATFYADDLNGVYAFLGNLPCIKWDKLKQLLAEEV